MAARRKGGRDEEGKSEREKEGQRDRKNYRKRRRENKTLFAENKYIKNDYIIKKISSLNLGIKTNQFC